MKFGSFNTINQLESQHVNSKRRQKEDPPIPLPRYVNMNYKLEQNMAFQGMHDKSRVHEKAQIITVVRKISLPTTIRRYQRDSVITTYKKHITSWRV